MRKDSLACSAACVTLLTFGLSSSASAQGRLGFSGNRVYCGLSAVGEFCTEYGNIFPGNSWPSESGQAYIFKAGLQLAAIIDVGAGFAWAGDTVGALFFDLRGTQEHGQALTPLLSSRDTADLASWPPGAHVNDTSAFDALYVGRRAVSDHDAWVRYWDGSPQLISGRTHPVGVLVEQRTVAWDSPEWNRDVVYFVLTLTNVTGRSASVYANPTIPPVLRADLAALGARFQDSSEARFGIAIPDDGYALDSVFLGLAMDPDVADPGRNYATVSVPFGMPLAYSADFIAPSFWRFPAEIHGQPPFLAAPGLVGARFVRAPGEHRWFANHSNAFPEPVGVHQLWRYLSGHLGPSDPVCMVANPIDRGVCFVTQQYRDVRYSSANGPFRLAPGEARTVVLAYLFAAPLDTARAYVGGNLVPGVPANGDLIAADPSRVTVIERVAGWRDQSDASGNNRIEASEVVTAPRSLLDKAQLAEALADAKFLLPQPPAPPRFFLIPDDNHATIVWQPSPTEAAGDPYFAVAADRTSALYDPNFRRFDVEGYRVYRGTSPDRLTLVAQFDYQGTELRDHTGNLYYNGRCAPELGVQDDCPVAFPPVPDTTVYAVRELVGSLVQIPPGSRIESTNGTIITLIADTVGGTDGVPRLADTGMPFTWVDTTVRNGYTYYYAVTAFDVNSIRSGPTSFESAPSAQPVAPRRGSGQTAGAVPPTVTLVSAGGSALDASAPVPGVDPSSGNFLGPMPPANGLEAALDAFIPEILGTDTAFIRIDSVVPDPSSSAFGYFAAIYYLTAVSSAGQRSVAMPVRTDFFSTESRASASLPAVALDQSQAERYGGDSTFQIPANVTITTPGNWRLASWGRASVNFDPPNSDHNGPRWWSGTPNENTFAPNELQCTPAIGSCVQADLTRNAGSLPGVSPLFHLHAYSTVPSTQMRDLEGLSATVTRAADFRLSWNANGTIDSVFDVTHGVRVPYSPTLGASWGILTDSSFSSAGTNAASTADGRNDVLTWSDAFCVGPAPRILNQCGGAAQTPARLFDRARLAPVAATSSTYAATSALAQTGLGFILYLNGHFFLMQMPSLPTSGTVWHARFYSGTVTGTAAAANYAFVPAVRPPAVPGLRARMTFAGSTTDLVRTNDSLLARVHTVPDPYYGANALETVADSQRLAFVNLPARAIIRIYSVGGILINVLYHNDPTGGGEAYWNLRGRTGKSVASGVYFFHIETPDGRQKVGRFTVVNAYPR